MATTEELEEEVKILSQALVVYQEEEAQKVPFLTRVWRFFFGRTIYRGPRTCGYCSLWVPPVHECELREIKVKIRKYGLTWPQTEKQWFPVRGTCTLSGGSRRTLRDASCGGFIALKQYTQRIWS